MTDQQRLGDFDVPNVARMYDYYLGGKNHFPADRAAAEKVIELSRGYVKEAALENRLFLRRAVRFLAGECGVRRFLDLGTGLPTQGNVHEIALAEAPDAEVVYVDIDPLVAAHGRALLAGDPRVEFLEADLRDPDRIFAMLPERFTLDRPVGLLLVACLHFIPDEEDPAGIVARYRELLPPGSYIVISHVCSDSLQEIMAAAGNVYSNANAPFEARPRAAIERFFAGLELVEPGLVPVHEWRPEPDALPPRADIMAVLGGVGRRP